MSAEATLAVMEHATGTDAEWRLLMLLANEANRDGVVSGVSMEVLAKRMTKSLRGVAGVKGRLKESGQLEVLEDGGGRGRPAVYWLNLPGMHRPETPQDSVESSHETPQPAAPKADPGSSSTTTTSSSSSKGKDRDFVLALGSAVDPDLEAEAEIIDDGLGLLRQGRKVGNPGKVVSPFEMAIAAAAIAAFNRCFEWKRPDGKTVKGSDYGLGGNLTSIVQRIRDRPSWGVEKHVRLVESAWRIRWWEKGGSSERRPHPNVIYGGKSFDNVVQDAADEAAGEAPSTIRKRRYSRG